MTCALVARAVREERAFTSCSDAYRSIGARNARAERTEA